MYTGKVETRNATTSIECAGIVKRVGTGVSSLQEGDRVVVMAPGHFSTLESFPEWSCEKLRDSEEFSVLYPTSFLSLSLLLTIVAETPSLDRSPPLFS